VETAADVVEYLMAGASLVGVCTAGHMKGTERYARIIRDLEELLGSLGVSRPADVRGLTLKRIGERRTRGQTAVTVPVVPAVDEELCNACKKCAQACAYGAMEVKEKAHARPAGCIGCGLCVSVCPTGAISQVYYGV
jgi:dihydropyrimidine dehydrogenase (NAD+) subunit PreA